MPQSHVPMNGAGRTSRSGSRRGRNLATEVRAALLEDLILSGLVPPGEYLPSEADLCRRYDVSRITVRAALAGLNEAGYIRSQQGRGSVVVGTPEVLSSGLSQLASVETYAASQGKKVTTRDLEVTEIGLDKASAAALGLRPGTPAVEIRRVKLLGGKRIGWIVDIVPLEVASRDMLEERFDGSVLDVLAGLPDMGSIYSDCTLLALALSEEIAEKLGVEPGSPAMLMDEVTYSGAGEPINLSKAYMLNKYFNFVLRRRLSQG
ncbi:GntR family transcriptional regulator [Gordonia sp. zg691]|uniref:GntR family transcriptional regulator n=1 Tax=Gordonia jinghuaiqii TaxID=2758710 RepID=A0A7D7LXW4_9ACTN|nr:GntR family transcriptional regulator [Gordonia jinghuaiqii]MBD0861936.1 GntR family transcriptional regulator [Gordonia jinghuaiqii]MCR5977841.1 UTRA domain-containing protein [Gordonia jinghuaiqii]QMT02498.1 GntR family transcriptional regulator [Gordonia jinghuaiqii]